MVWWQYCLCKCIWKLKLHTFVSISFLLLVYDACLHRCDACLYEISTQNYSCWNFLPIYIFGFPLHCVLAYLCFSSLTLQKTSLLHILIGIQKKSIFCSTLLRCWVSGWYCWCLRCHLLKLVILDDHIILIIVVGDSGHPRNFKLIGYRIGVQ